MVRDVSSPRRKFCRRYQETACDDEKMAFGAKIIDSRRLTILKSIPGKEIPFRVNPECRDLRRSSA